MKSEKEKMISGEMYLPADIELSREREKTRLLLLKFNQTPEDRADIRNKLLKELLPNTGHSLWIQPPFYCDYGYNIITGENVYFNFNCVVLDVAEVKIGSRCLFGPNVQIYTATHPLNHTERASGLEYAKPISIGEDVWIGGSTVILPGITIGDRTIIGAGSVVTKDIPADVIAAGNPCRIIRNV